MISLPRLLRPLRLIICSIAAAAAGTTLLGTSSPNFFASYYNNTFPYGQSLLNSYVLSGTTLTGPATTISGSKTGLGQFLGQVATYNGYVYVTDPKSDEVHIFTQTANGNVAPFAIIYGSATQLNQPYGVAVNSTNIFIANQGSITVYRINDSGNVAPQAIITGSLTQLGTFGSPVLAIDSKRIYSSQIDITATVGTILEYNLNDNGNVAPINTISLPTHLLPYGIAVDATSLYAAYLNRDASDTGGMLTYPLAASGAATPTSSFADSSLGEPDTLMVVGPNVYVADDSYFAVKVYPKNASGSVSPTATLNVNADRIFRVVGIAVMLPAVTSVTPGAVLATGGTLVTLGGSNFTGVTQLAVGSQNVPTFTIVSDSVITFNAPAASAGVYDITVTGAVGQSITGAVDQITYVGPPVVTGLTPTGGGIGGGARVTITGNGFTGATQVAFGTKTVSAGSFTVVSDTQISVNAPAVSAGAVADVTVTNVAGTSATSGADQYTYVVGPPAISSVTPSVANIAGGSALTVNGSNFTGASSLAVGGQNVATFTANGDAQITFTAPAHAAGLVDVTVTTNIGTNTLGASDQVLYEGAPTVTSVSPLGILAGSTTGQTVTVTGTNFTGVTQVTLGGVAVTYSFSANTPATLTLTAPFQSALGYDVSYDVQVTTPIGASALVPSDVVTYEAAPTISTVSPTQGASAGGTAVAITGVHFVGTTAVYFGGIPATSFTQNGNTIMAIAPAGTTGVVDIGVTTTAGSSSASAADQYTYQHINPLVPATLSTLTSAGTATTPVNQSFSYQITSTGGTTSYTATGLPAGLTLNAATGQITGAPTAAGTYTVTLGLKNSAGTGSATLTITVASGALTSQTINFPTPTNVAVNGLSYPLGATASSGLPVTYTLVSGPAGLTGSSFTVSSSLPVTITASQAGNGTFASATPVTVTFTAMPPTMLSFFGTGPVGFSTTGSVHPQVAASNFAATVNAARTAGTLIGFLPSLNAGFVANFAIGPGGAFAAPALTLGAGTASAQSLSISGTVTNTGLSGSIAGYGSFSLGADPLIGPSSSVQGIYFASVLQSSSGNTYSIVGSQNEVLVLFVSPQLVSFGTGTVANGSFTVAGTSSATISGMLNSGTAAMTGTVTSATGTNTFAGVSTATPVADRLINLSTRGMVTPSSPLTAGFVISGTTAKTVLLRAVGPTLATFGITSALARPLLTLSTASGSLVATNTGWAGSTTLSTAFASAGAFAFAAGSADCAILTTLTPGKYSLQVTDGAADAGGVALVEIYDASIDPTGVTQKLVNVSTLGQVGAGNTALIAGFIVSGNNPKQVMIRGVGPSLAAFGVAGLIADPVLNVYDGSGNLIAQNNDWGTAIQVGTAQIAAAATQLSSVAAQVGAFALTAGSKDAAVIVTLAPGAYSAQVANGTTAAGNCLVEIYEVSP